jgi:hypothetical protein
MTWFSDLSPCDYFPFPHSDKLLAVGWLDSSQQFNVGEISKPVYDKLNELLRDPWRACTNVISAAFMVKLVEIRISWFRPME